MQNLPIVGKSCCFSSEEEDGDPVEMLGWGVGDLSDVKWDSCPSLAIETCSLYTDLSQRGYILGYIYMCIYMFPFSEGL